MLAAFERGPNDLVVREWRSGDDNRIDLVEPRDGRQIVATIKSPAAAPGRFAFGRARMPIDETDHFEAAVIGHRRQVPVKADPAQSDFRDSQPRLRHEAIPGCRGRIAVTSRHPLSRSSDGCELSTPNARADASAPASGAGSFCPARRNPRER